MAHDACSVLASRESLAGSAPFARGWLVVEHAGPWGRDALTDSGLPPSVVAHISNAQRDASVRFLVARSLGHDRRRYTGLTHRRVWLAACNTDGGQTRTTTIDAWEEILDWNLADLGRGEVPAVGDELNGAIEFVCTHSKRDACCAVLGRELVNSVPERLRTQVWECSHLGGHRFAATSLFLPSGRLYGRLSAEHRYLDAHLSEPAAEFLRGPSYHPAPLQAAECAARIDGKLPSATTVHVRELPSTGPSVLASVHVDSGPAWTISCIPDTVTGPASCGARSEQRTVWLTEIIERRI